MQGTVAPFPNPVDFEKWIEDHKEDLKPPVGNKMLYGSGQHMVMVVGGPNIRKDYHIQRGEEIFYQLKGDMTLEIMQQGKPFAVPIKEGEIFILPGGIPHSPQRPEGTLGLVIERQRGLHEIDGLRWYRRADPQTILYQETFHCTDLGVQLKPVIERFFSSKEYETDIPAKDYAADCPLYIDTETVVPKADNLLAWIEQYAKGKNVVYSPSQYLEAADEQASVREGEYKVEIKTCPCEEDATTWKGIPTKGELFLYQMRGTSIVRIRRTTNATAGATSAPQQGEITEVQIPPGHVLLVPGKDQFELQYEWADGGICLAVTNSVCVTDE